jgi:hypothetical protein
MRRQRQQLSPEKNQQKPTPKPRTAQAFSETEPLSLQFLIPDKGKLLKKCDKSTNVLNCTGVKTSEVRFLQVFQRVIRQKIAQTETPQ